MHDDDLTALAEAVGVLDTGRDWHPLLDGAATVLAIFGMGFMGVLACLA